MDNKLRETLIELTYVVKDLNTSIATLALEMQKLQGQFLALSAKVAILEDEVNQLRNKT